MLVVAGPVRLLADVDAVQRRLGDVDVPLADQFRHVAEEEVEQQRRDVVAVGVGVHQQDDLAVAQPVEVELVAGPGADGGDQVGEFLVRRAPCAVGRSFAVEDLAAQRQHGLRVVVAALLGRAAGRVAFDDEQFGLVAGRSTCSRRACPAGSAGGCRATCASPPWPPRATPRAPSRPGRSGRRSRRPRSCCCSATLPAPGGRSYRPSASISGLLSLSFVCPWNCGSRTKTDRTPTTPSRMSSAVIFSPLILMSCVSM